MGMDINGLNELTGSLETLPQRVRDAANRGIARATARVYKDAFKNAPKSPTMAQAARATRKTRRDTSKSRKPTATTRAKPGGLERSISMATDKARIEGSVFVAANSEAGKYAGRLHDEKGSGWSKRGPGTIAKGPQADEKFISRAVSSNEGNTTKVIADELGKVEL